MLSEVLERVYNKNKLVLENSYLIYISSTGLKIINQTPFNSHQNNLY